MRKILLFVHELTYSGSPNSTLRLARALSELGYRVETWSYIEGPFRVEYEKFGIKIDIVSKDDLRSRKIINRCKQFDLLIANSILTSEAIEGLGSIIPAIWYIREAENIPEFFENNYKRGLILQRCEDILAVSEYAAKYIKEYFNANVHVLHNCVDDMYESYKKVSYDNEKIKIIMIGTIERRKNFSLLIDAFLLLPQYYRNQIELHLVGRMIENEKNYYENVTKSAIENEDIFFYGEIHERKEMMNLISQMDLLAVVSKDESCSLTALEGAMMSKPLLLSKNIGAQYLVDETNGWIVETDSIVAIQNVLKEVCENKQNLKIMGTISRKKYEETSTFEIYKQNVDKLLKNKRYCKPIYSMKHILDRIVWYYDDTTKYFRYPDWGYKDENKHLYSYDIFDTLITRDVATPVGIFALMQEELLNNPFFSNISDFIKENFVDIRIGAEGLARQTYCIGGIEDKTIDQIYEALCVTGGISSDDANILKKLEIKLENEHCVGINENIALVKDLILAGKRVVLISDMYLPSDVIRGMLLKVDNIFNDIPIYVSSEFGKMKGTTHLFKSVQEKEKVSFSNWTHMGDNINADINSPSSLGIKTIHYLKSQISDIDKKIIANREKDYYVQQIVGMNRKLKLLGMDNHALIDESIIYTVQIILPFIHDVTYYIKKNNYEGIFLAGNFGDLVNSLFGKSLNKEKIKTLFWPKWLIDHRRNLQMPIESFAKVILYEINSKKLSHEDFLNIFDISEEELSGYILKFAINGLQFDLLDGLNFLFKDSTFIDFLNQKRNKLLEKMLINEDFSNYVFVDYDESNSENITNFLNNYFVQSYFFTSKNFEIGVQRKSKELFYLKLNSDEKNTSNYLFNKAFECLHRSSNLLSIIENCMIRIINPNVTTNYKNSVHSIEKDFLRILREKDRVSIDEYTKEYQETNKIFSFGLFETLITLDLANEDGIYLLIKRHMELVNKKYGYTDKFIDDFISIRKEAEIKLTNLYNAHRLKTRNLDEIYNYIYNISNISYKAVYHLKKYERYLVGTHISGVYENIEKVRKLVNEGKEVYIIAKTWFDEALIRQILHSIDPILDDCILYLTSECREYIKDANGFFEYIKNREKIKIDKWVHIGNDLTFDIHEPKKLGIVTERTMLTQLLPYEKAALNEFIDQLSVQAKIGIAKVNRMTSYGGKEFIIGNALGGPILYSYVQWILDDAIERKFNKLLFVARDGFILKKIADIIISNQHLPIKTEYVYGSRRAWRMPSYSASDNLEIFFKMAHLDQLYDIEAFSRIFKISCLELMEYLPNEYRNPKRKLAKQDYIFIRKCLEENEDFRAFLEKRALDEKIKVIKYFKNICGDDSFAFVELSGTGSTQNCLAKILHHEISQKICTYFLNLDGLKQVDNAMFLNYMPNNFKYVWIIENLCRAPHGQTDGYEEKDGKIEPIISESQEAEALIKHGYLKYIYGVMQFAQSFSQLHYIQNSDKESPILFQKYLKHITYNPCAEVLEFIGDMPFESTGFSSKVEVFAPKLTLEQMQQIFLTRGDESIDTYYTGACFDYTLKRMSQEEREKIEYYRNAVSTREGQVARNRKRLNEKGLLYTIKFSYRRAIRLILLKCGIIKY